MEKTQAKGRAADQDRDTMRPEYDFSKGVRGVTAARYRKGTNVIVLDPSVMDVFPDSEAVNEALRALAPSSVVAKAPSPGGEAPDERLLLPGVNV